MVHVDVQVPLRLRLQNPEPEQPVADDVVRLAQIGFGLLQVVDFLDRDISYTVVLLVLPALLDISRGVQEDPCADEAVGVHRLDQRFPQLLDVQILGNFEQERDVVNGAARVGDALCEYSLLRLGQGVAVLLLVCLRGRS